MRPTALDEPESSAAFDRISENSLSVYRFEASLTGEVPADKEGAPASSQRTLATVLTIKVPRPAGARHGVRVTRILRMHATSAAFRGSPRAMSCR